MNFIVRTAILLGATLTLAGCEGKSAPKPENFLQTLNAYFPDHRRDCLFDSNQRFPYTTSDKAEQKKFDTLVKAQLLKPTKEQNIVGYELSDYGKNSGPKFCYGYREAKSIVSSTPLEVKDGFKQTTVVYQFEMKDVPAWAKDTDLQGAFPDLQKKLSGTATDKSQLAQTTAGWTVPE